MSTTTSKAAVGSPGTDYRHAERIAAPAERVFAALTTLAGLGGWWTPYVTGVPSEPASEIRFEFEGLDEHILMRVDRIERPYLVNWTCLAHTSFPEWNGTRI